MHAHDVVQALAIVLGVAAVTTVLFQRLRQPVVLGYMIAGLIIGPHVPVPLVADREIVLTLAEEGVIVLMFSLGLEFSLRRLVQVAPTAGVTAVIQCSLMLWLGFEVGQLFGWTVMESVFCGAIIAISSTTIIAKAFDEQQVRGPLRELVVAILIVEDLFAVLLMAGLTAAGSGKGVSAGALAQVIGELTLFLVATMALGMLTIPRAIRLIARLGRAETTLVASLGVCFGGALLASALGYSVALGAFLAGSLIAESGEQRNIEHLVTPVRDMFAAIFFVSVGMLIDPALVYANLGPIAVLIVVVIAGKLVGVALGAFLSGSGVRTSVQAGMSLAQIGEFSFIIASLGLTLDATRSFLYPVAIAVSAVTTLTTPWMIRASGPVAAYFDRKLPRPLQTFASLYTSWLERMRSAPRRDTTRARLRRLIVLMLIDGLVLGGVLIGSIVAAREVEPQWLVVVVAGLLGLPFAWAMVNIAGRIGAVMGDAVFPAAEANRVDLVAAPRRALVVALQLAAVLLLGLPVVALTQPFLPGASAALGFAVILVVLGVLFWRTATNLHGHVRAASQVIVHALARQGAPETPAAADVTHALRVGLGDPVVITLAPDSPAVGRTLAEIEVRGLTGAIVLAITRDGETIIADPHDPLRAGDVLAVAGAGETIAAARSLLLGQSAA
ncbi:MAG TPA: cation:proton antiporter [Kofleriaceae bacterium]|nr:cation:proton antiporter [Kofleriaceae bacterium]